MVNSAHQSFAFREDVTSDKLNKVSDAVIGVYASASSRDTALPTPNEGMRAYLQDTKRISRYDGSAWIEDMALDLQNLPTDLTDDQKTNILARIGAVAAGNQQSEADEPFMLPELVTQQDAESGSSSEEKLWSPERVRQAITAQRHQNLTVIIWGRFASQPTPQSITAPSTPFDDPGGGWYYNKANATGSDPLYYAITTATYQQGSWTYNPQWNVVAADLPEQYSENATSWHAARTDDDVWIRVRLREGEWSVPIWIGDVDTQPLEWHYIGHTHLAVNSDFAFNLSATHDLGNYADMLIVRRRFSGWSNWSAGNWESFQYAWMPTRDIRTVSSSNDNDSYITSSRNVGITARFSTANTFLGIGPDRDLGEIAGDENYFQAFTFGLVRNSSSNTDNRQFNRIRIATRAINWDHSMYRFYLR